jgi:plastocyanin
MANQPNNANAAAAHGQHRRYPTAVRNMGQFVALSGRRSRALAFFAEPAYRPAHPTDSPIGGGNMRRIRTAALAALVAAFAFPVAAQQPTVLTVQVYSFGFAPKPIHLTAGQPVTHRFVNQSGSSHDFTAPGFFQHSKITAGAAPEGEIELKGHETKTITLVPARGTYQAHCSHFLHKQMGMSDWIVVS